MGLGGYDLGTWLQAAQSADNHLIASLQAFTDLPARTLHGTGRHIARFGAAVGADDHDLRAAIAAALHRALGHENGLFVGALRRAHAHEHARQQHAVAVGELAA